MSNVGSINASFSMKDVDNISCLWYDYRPVHTIHFSDKLRHTEGGKRHFFRHCYTENNNTHKPVYLDGCFAVSERNNALQLLHAFDLRFA